jgi:hypothetical protein
VGRVHAEGLLERKDFDANHFREQGIGYEYARKNNEQPVLFVLKRWLHD